MPKAWSEQEKEMVKAALQKEGKKLFEKYGLQKTTVDEIVRAARISKGAFYNFYKSKEELYFDILEEMEKKLHEEVYSNIIRPGLTKRESFRQFLRNVIDTMTTNPIYSQLNTSDYEYLLRKLPEETVKDHVKNDFDKLARHFGALMDKGWMRKVGIKALSGLMVSLFYFIMHREDLGGLDFNASMELWIDMLTVYLIPEE